METTASEAGGDQTTEVATTTKGEATTKVQALLLDETYCRALYEDELTSIVKTIGSLNPSWSQEEAAIASSVEELYATGDVEQALMGIGYTLADVNQDGVLELLILDVDRLKSTGGVGTRILEVLTISGEEEKTQTLFFPEEEGVSYYLTETGVYAEAWNQNEVSKLMLLSWMNGELTIAEEYDRSSYEATEFMKLQEKLRKAIRSYKIETFYDYAKLKKIGLFSHAGYSTNSKESLGVYFLEDVTEPLTDENYIHLVISREEPVSTVVFQSPQSIKSVKILSLTFLSADNGGNLSFRTKELGIVEKLQSGKFLGVDITFYGDLPSYGIEYMDNLGAVHQYGITISGKDGLPELVPINTNQYPLNP